MLAIKTYTKLFEAAVVQVLNYSSEIWRFKQLKNSDDIQRRVIRYYLSAPILRGEMDWHSIRLTRWLNMLKCWNRLIHVVDNRLTKKIFNCEFH